MAKLLEYLGTAGTAPYVAASGIVGGGTSTIVGPFDTTGILNPADDTTLGAVLYAPWGASFEKHYTGLVAGSKHIIRVQSVGTPGSNFAFNINANGVLKARMSFVNGLDDGRAKIERFEAVADGSGNIVLEFICTAHADVYALASAIDEWPVQTGVPQDLAGLVVTALPVAGFQCSWTGAVDTEAVRRVVIECDTVNTFDSADFVTFTTYRDLDFSGALAKTGTLYYVRARYENDGNHSVNWATGTVLTTAALLKENVGGGAIGAWDDDTHYSNGTTNNSGGVHADISGISNPADLTVYDNWRQLGGTDGQAGMFRTYTGLLPSTMHLFRAHYRLKSAGIFNQIISVNGHNVSLLTQSDSPDVAYVRDIYAPADSDGNAVFRFRGNVGTYAWLAGFSVQRAAAPWADGYDVNIVFTGDSITEGQPYTDDNFPRRLATLLGADYYVFSSPVDLRGSSIRITNVGIAGETSGTINTRFADDVLSRYDSTARLNVVCVLAGANDFGFNTGAGLVSTIAAMFAAARGAGFDTCIDATNTHRNDMLTTDEETCRNDANTLRRSGDDDADILIDIDANSEFDDFMGGNYSEESVKVHYSRAGNQIVAEMFYAEVLPILPGPEISTATPLAAGTQGTAYDQTLAGEFGVAPYTFAKDSGDASVSISADGHVTDAAATAGTRSFVARITGDNGATSTKAFTFTISAVAAPTITTVTLDSGVSGDVYHDTIEFTGGVAPVVLSVDSGALPTGLTLDGSTGDIDGTINAVTDNYLFIARATDALGRSATKSLSIDITERSKVTILAGVVVEYHGALTPSYAQLENATEFIAADGTIVGHGYAAWGQRFTASLASNMIIIGEGDAYITANSSTPQAEYRWLAIYDTDNVLITRVFKDTGLQVPVSEESITWRDVYDHTLTALATRRRT